MLGNIIDYRSSGGGSFVFNDRSTIRTGEWLDPFYFIKVDSVDGHYGSDLSYESHPIPNATGEKSGDVFRRGKTLTFSGTIWARTARETFVAADFMQQMLSETAQRQLVFIPWNYGFELYYVARPFQDLSIVESFDNFTPKLQFVFGLRCDDPRSYLLSDDSVFPTWQ